MSKRLCILGKAVYAIAIQLDIVLQCGLGFDEIVIVKNQIDLEPYIAYIPEGIEVIEIMDTEYVAQQGDCYHIGSIGRSRHTIYNYFKNLIIDLDTRMISLIHPSAIVGEGVTLGKGICIGPGVVIAPFVKVNDYVVINRSVSIGHHTIVENFVTINPAVSIAGVCTIGENAYIGIGAIIVDQIQIGANSIVGAGSLVLKSVTNNTKVIGSPAKELVKSK
jgi:sugar O-acyltransferase (sialic acid O-acetyltransferase NeuD family)